MALVRGGWRNRRGLGAFVVVALLVAGPWYLRHLSEFNTFLQVAGPHEGVPNGDTPPTFSIGNLGWYFWNILNSQFLAPLFALIVGGLIWTVGSLLRYRRVVRLTTATPEPYRPMARSRRRGSSSHGC